MRAMARILALLAALLLSLPAPSESFAAEWHDVTVQPKYGDPEIIRGELHMPSGDGPFPAVVMMHGCAGLTPLVAEGLEAHAAFLNENGFAALILDSFGPRDLDGGVVCESIEALTRARRSRTYDARGAHAFLSSLPGIAPANIFLMGQSNGAGTAVDVAFAKDAPYRAVVAFYPWCGSFPGTVLTAPLLVLAGSADDWTPPEACAGRVGLLSGAAYEIEVYEGAHHSFDLAIEPQSYKGHTVGGDPAATEAARSRMIGFFRDHMAE